MIKLNILQVSLALHWSTCASFNHDSYWRVRWDSCKWGVDVQEKYENAADALAEMEKRAVMAETMLEATLSYHALGTNNSPQSLGRSQTDPFLKG
jgi:hypothetical protein